MPPDPSLPGAVIFDMDGVLIDSNPFHIRKWVDFFRQHGIAIADEELPKIVLGPPNENIFRRYFGGNLTVAQMDELSEELEANFRRAFAPHARPIPGARELVEECHAHGVALAVASAAMAKNVEFALCAIGLRPYFRQLLSGDEVSHPKPHPEVYLKAAAKLGVEPGVCVALEDSFVGVESAKGAGMKCIAVASTFPAEDLCRETHADLIVPGIDRVSLQTLRQVFDGHASLRPGF